MNACEILVGTNLKNLPFVTEKKVMVRWHQ